MKTDLTLELDKDDLWVIVRALEALMEQPNKPDKSRPFIPDYEYSDHQNAKSAAYGLKTALLEARTITVAKGVTLRDD